MLIIDERFITRSVPRDYHRITDGPVRNGAPEAVLWCLWCVHYWGMASDVFRPLPEAAATEGRTWMMMEARRWLKRP